MANLDTAEVRRTTIIKELKMHTRKFTTKLRCKPCGLFYRDGGITSKTFEGITTECENCGGELIQIRVHNLKIASITVSPKSTIGAK